MVKTIETRPSILGAVVPDDYPAELAAQMIAAAGVLKVRAGSRIHRLAAHVGELPASSQKLVALRALAGPQGPARGDAFEALALELDPPLSDDPGAILDELVAYFAAERQWQRSERAAAQMSASESQEWRRRYDALQIEHEKLTGGAAGSVGSLQAERDRAWEQSAARGEQIKALEAQLDRERRQSAMRERVTA